VVVVLALVPVVAGSFTVSLLNDIGIGALVALGLVLLTGVGGATSFGQAAFVGIAAYATAWLTTTHGMSPWIGLLFALLLTGAVGARHRHAHAAAGRALSAAEHHRLGPVDRDAVRQRRALGSHTGLSNVPPVRIGAWSLLDPRSMYYLVWVLVGLAYLFCRNVLHSRTGRAMRGLRGGNILLSSVGADPYRLRLTLFVLAALLAGVAGWLYAHTNRFVSPAPFDVRASIEYLLMAVAGGMGHLLGALVGAALVLLMKNTVQDVLPMLTSRGGQFEAVVFAALFILLLQYARGGRDGPGGWTRWPMARPQAAPHDAATVEPLPHVALPARAAPCCRCNGAVKRFGGLTAVDDVSFEVRLGRDRRPDRAQRRRQVDHVQPAHRHAAHDVGPGRVPGPGRHPPVAARHRAAGAGPHLPAREAAPAHEPAGQRGAGRALPHPRRHRARRPASSIAPRRRRSSPRPGASWTASAWPSARTSRRAACRWARSASWRSPARWPPTRCCWCWTNPRPACAARRSRPSAPCSSAARRRGHGPHRRTRHGLRHEAGRPAGGDELRLQARRRPARRGARRPARAGGVPGGSGGGAAAVDCGGCMREHLVIAGSTRHPAPHSKVVTGCRIKSGMTAGGQG
jgi:ABC-type branched-subunit amino acid transport system permease subunit